MEQPFSSGFSTFSFLADSVYPTLDYMPKSKKTMLTGKEWEKYMKDKNDGKDFVWNNYWTKIDEKREWKGEFKKDHKAEWEGLG